MQVVISGEKFLLLPEKASYWPGEKMLVIADFHLGKANHFRRSGIPVPTSANDKNLDTLIYLIQKYTPEEVFFLGDLFHSHYNSEWDTFGNVMANFPDIIFSLSSGNHDVMSDYQYQKFNIRIFQETRIIRNIIWSHAPLEKAFEGYNIAGHIHPAVKLTGKGRQGLRLPCFHFSNQKGLLPAFGTFTGMYTLKPHKNDSVYIVVEGEVIQVN